MASRLTLLDTGKPVLPAPFLIKTSGIYALVNALNGKVYIGSALRLNWRLNVHRCELSKGIHHSVHLQRSFNKSPHSFYAEIIETLDRPSKSLILEREQFWMDFYQAHNRDFGYNVCPKANSCQGIKRTPEFLAKVSAGLKGKRMSPQRLEQHRLAMRGHKGGTFTDEQRQAARLRATGRKKSAETRARLSASLRLWRGCVLPVLQFSLDGTFIKRHASITEAEMDLGLGRSNISSACNGKRRHANGFVWKYEDEAKPDESHPVRPRLKRRTKSSSGSSAWQTTFA